MMSDLLGSNAKKKIARNEVIKKVNMKDAVPTIAHMSLVGLMLSGYLKHIIS